MFPVSHEINIPPSSIHRVISKKAPVMNGSFSGKSWKKITQRANLEIIIKKLVGNHQMPTIRMWAQLICSTPKPSWCCELWFLVKVKISETSVKIFGCCFKFVSTWKLRYEMQWYEIWCRIMVLYDVLCLPHSGNVMTEPKVPPRYEKETNVPFSDSGDHLNWDFSVKRAEWKWF